jgi:transposase
MAIVTVDLARRVVEAYEQGLSGTYVETAKIFGIGKATVSRILRRKRETGDVIPKPKGGNNPRRVDLEWLRQHAIDFPDARLVDRVEAWVAAGNPRVAEATMWNSLRAISFTHKKNSGRKGTGNPGGKSKT